MKYIYIKILFSFLLILVLNLVISTGLLINFTKQDFNQNLEEHLLSSAQVLEGLVNANGIGPGDTARLDTTVKRLGEETDLRVTVIDRSGVVLADSASDPAIMENHAHRPEIEAALQGVVGRSTRVSPTLGIRMTYLAIPLWEDNRIEGVVRVAMRQERIGAQVVQMVYVSSILATAAGALIAAIVSVFVARIYSRPIQLIRDAAVKISEGDFKYRLQLNRRDELSHVADALNDMSAKLGETFKMLRREKERNATILDGLNEQVLFIGPGDSIFLANEALCNLLGLQAENIVERDYNEVIPNEDIRTFIADASRSAHPITRDVAIPLAGKEPRYYRLSSSPILSKKGRFRGVVVIFHNVHLIKEMERMRREFLDNASHELKTPISAVLAAAETLLEHEPGDTARRARFYKTIVDNTQRLNNLITDMLDLSEIEQKKASLDFAPHDVSAIVRDVIGEFWPDVGKKNHTLEIKVPGDPVIVQVDRESLAKALGNLVDNAIRYTDPGGRISVRVERVDATAQVRIDIEDNGIGMPQHDLERIFERFYRIDKARSLRTGSTGLGLAIVKHIMETLGGKVAVTSSPGKGSCFSLLLPITHTATDAASSADVVEIS